jgi:hypothetical protein
MKLVELKSHAEMLGIAEIVAPMKSKAEVIAAIQSFKLSDVEKSVGSVEKQDSEKKPVEKSGQKSQDSVLNQKDDLQNHPKFAKFKKGDK